MVELCLVLALFSADSVPDLKNAMQTTGSAESYRFTVQDQGKSLVTGTFQKNVPVAMRADDIDFFRQANALVYRSGNTWTKTRTGTLSDPLPVLAASAKVSGVRLPHEELVQLEKVVRNLKTVGGQDTAISAELDATGAKAFARSEDHELARSGTVQFWVSQGQISKYRITIRLQGRRGNADVDGEVTRIVTISHVGDAKVEVPEAVKTLLRP
jgi:hypothetical protein